MAKSKKGDSPAKSTKINVDISPYNWERLTGYIDAYNSSEDRTTPKLKYTAVINEALAKFLGKVARKEGKSS